MWADDGEILESLRRRGVRNVNDNSQVISDSADAALERARETLLGQSEVKRQPVLAAFQYRYRRVVIIRCCTQPYIQTDRHLLQSISRSYTNRIYHIWNALSSCVIEAASVITLRRLLDSHPDDLLANHAN